MTPGRVRFWRSAFQALLLAAVPLAAAASPQGQQPATAKQVRAAAAGALEAGDSKTAYAFSSALLQRDPNDRTALLLNAQAARSLGNFKTARQSARRAWQLADTGEDKFNASLIMAQALSSGGQRNLAQFWLRRAAHHAPSRLHERRAIRDFQYLRATTPWHHRLSFSITPDSNVNNGSSETSIYVPLYGRRFGLSGSAQALSGIEHAVELNSRYRFKASETRAHDLLLSAEYRTYTLSSEAKAQAPGTKGSDFAFGSLTAGYAHKGLNFGRRGEYRLGIDTGQSWYGGEEYTRFLRLNAGQSYKLTPNRTLGAKVLAESHNGLRANDLDTLRGDLSYSFRTKSGLSVWSSLSVAEADSSSAVEDFTELGLQAQITLPKPVFGAIARFGFSARSRDYPLSSFSPAGRQDDKFTADFSLTFRQVDYYGFSPTLRLSGSTTDSNIDLYKSNRLGVNFGIQSAF